MFSYDLSKIVDWETITREPLSEAALADPYSREQAFEVDGVLMRTNPITTAIIWKTLAVQIGTITEANAGEFYARCAILEALDGPSCVHGDGSPWNITPDDVILHIGLTTNATYKPETRSKWLTRIVGDHMNGLVSRVDERIGTIKDPRGVRGSDGAPMFEVVAETVVEVEL